MPERPERFAAFIAHELRGPIALQRALVEVALADAETDATALREMAQRVLVSCEQQQRLIDALIELTRGGRRLSRSEPVDLAAIVPEGLRTHNLTGVRRTVVLKPAWVLGDHDLLVRLAANLTSNAIQHNLPAGRVHLATATVQGRAVLSIANTGPAIPPGEVERLFQPFERLSASSLQPGEGLGLGLTIVQAIAEAHRASISARARPGGGLTIQIGFPALIGPPRTQTGADNASLALAQIQERESAIASATPL
ncbi:MAG TPA: HAMP domain-containing sensor histidine kinase [Solirubrobacteraceae bacterium]|jgi:signal transduction histidine kinase